MSHDLSITQRYGYRTLILLILILIFASYLLFEYYITGELHPTLLFLSVLFYFIEIVLFIGFSLTRVKKIDKKYFTINSLIGKEGKVIKGCKPGEKGSATISSEDWTVESDDELREGDKITVIDVMEDKVTLKVKKLS